MEKLTIRDFDAAGKRVLVRVDFNVPIEDGRVTGRLPDPRRPPHASSTCSSAAPRSCS